MGSLSEGTRLWLANELDLMATFGNKNMSFIIRKDDPFHLYGLSKGNASGQIAKYFTLEGQFVLAVFMRDFLGAVDRAVRRAFGDKTIPPAFERRSWRPRDCLNCGPGLERARIEGAVFKHCKNCTPTVTQTKVGV